jgi:PepSY-associated transmembrane protein
MRTEWRRALIYTHRWLGIAGGVLFVTWFASGIVMMYARMPELTAEERRTRLSPIDLSAARITVADAARNAAACGAGGPPCERVRISMLGDRLVYRVQRRGEPITIFADTGEPLRELTGDQAIDLARRFAPEHASTLRYDALLIDPDQWTLIGDARRTMPLHRVALGDPEDTDIYISAKTGEVVMKTTGSGRRWGYLGAVLHWIYFTPLRRHGPLWNQVIIWSSLAGCVLCLSGLVWGVVRYSPSARYRLKREQSPTPYAGLMRWHHYAGLLVGLASFTWIFSGLLSMDPWDWHPSTAPTRQQREAVTGGPLRLDAISVSADVAQPFRAASETKEIEIAQFRGEPFFVAHDAPIRFDRDTLLAAARTAMPDVGVADVTWLEDYDAYYYDRDRALSLPVLRVRYADPQRTWLYLDPRRGAIVRKEERLTRVNRWLYHGLHSLDFPFLYHRRPLWDVVVIALSLGGIVLSATTLVPMVHRLRRHVRRIAGGRYATRFSARVSGRSLTRPRRAGGGGVM